MNDEQVIKDFLEFQESYIIAKVAAIKLSHPGALAKWSASSEFELYDVEICKPKEKVEPPKHRARCRCAIDLL